MRSYESGLHWMRVFEDLEFQQLHRWKLRVKLFFIIFNLHAHFGCSIYPLPPAEARQAGFLKFASLQHSVSRTEIVPRT